MYIGVSANLEPLSYHLVEISDIVAILGHVVAVEPASKSGHVHRLSMEIRECCALPERGHDIAWMVLIELIEELISIGPKPRDGCFTCPVAIKFPSEGLWNLGCLGTLTSA